MKKSEATRLNILQKAYELIYQNGYQTTSIDDILATTKVTKGAFYYHFKNKDEMGIAIIKEILQPKFINQITQTFSLETNTVEALYIMITKLLSDNDFMKFEHGCPVSNLIQEMTPKSFSFTEALQELTQEWQNIIVKNIEAGKKADFIKPNVQPQSVALFIISSYWGIRNFGRMNSGNNAYRSYLKELKNYLNSLK
ncbi:TetR/AcrR family transcriptional regulator [Empedobacter brevis]|uniref:TetR/AcrR family transcriptional regulator n=1 Tax=Empedobacter brevis TaxID=247 RepID=UPI00289BD392|nr:TetR/AcrR family transcriptional regulator [Empedobacter brevis]